MRVQEEDGVKHHVLFRFDTLEKHLEAAVWAADGDPATTLDNIVTTVFKFTKENTPGIEIEVVHLCPYCLQQHIPDTALITEFSTDMLREGELVCQHHGPVSVDSVLKGAATANGVC